MSFKELKIELIKKNKTFMDLVRLDGRSWQYLHKSCSQENKKVLNEMYKILKKL